MSFRDLFLGAQLPHSEASFGRGSGGFEPKAELLAELRQAIRSFLESSLERVRAGAGGAAFASEIVYQLKSMEASTGAEGQGRWDGDPAHPPSDLEIADAIQRHCNYLGSHLCGIRWAAERRMSERSLRNLSKAMENLHRQDFQSGIRLYDSKEYSLARESFQKALSATPTNYFAHQYLGFIAVHEDVSGEAVNHFETSYKYAETDSHRALALSHLARCHSALGSPDKAAAFAKKAAELDESAGFWYEYAGYAAVAGDLKPVPPAILSSMQKDWVFWAVAIVDPQLDRVRAEVTTLMNDIRERISRRSRKALDQLRDLSEGILKLGGIDVGLLQAGLHDLERRFSENNIYQFRDVAAEGEELVRRASKVARETVGVRIAARKRGLRKNDHWRDEQVGQLSDPVQRLRIEQQRLGASFRVWNAGCFTYCLIWCLYMFFVVTFITRAAWKDTYVIPYVLSFVVPFAFPAAVNALNYYLSVARPRGNLESRIRALEKKVNPAVEGIEKTYKERREAIAQELRELEGLLERIERAEAAA